MLHCLRRRRCLIHARPLSQLPYMPKRWAIWDIILVVVEQQHNKDLFAYELNDNI